MHNEHSVKSFFFSLSSMFTVLVLIMVLSLAISKQWNSDLIVNIDFEKYHLLVYLQKIYWYFFNQICAITDVWFSKVVRKKTRVIMTRINFNDGLICLNRTVLQTYRSNTLEGFINLHSKSCLLSTTLMLVRFNRWPDPILVNLLELTNLYFLRLLFLTSKFG